ncbi:methionyl-tRNA formyltransferase [Microvirga antarctica]|uniref:methionyl-tRNA formyltransferase n=1 Tax=Microvirga antarctica TaxID=2819233 RepID=UPI001B30997C|nr:formyltransferase family protein [Microvirga antarctica]
MRFAFAGIDFLGDVFETLIESGWTPVKLFSRPCDRVYDFNDTTVARARALRIPVQTVRIQPADLAGLSALRCEALIVAGYPWLIKGWETHLPYAVNFHPSPLPEARGPYPLFQAVLDQVPEWGMTAHVMEPAFDTGAIIAQRLFPTGSDETHDQLLAKCQLAAKDIARALATDLPALWKAASPQGAGSYWPRMSAAQRTIDWTGSVDEILRTVRAFGTIESFATVNSRLLHVWAASGWTQPHSEKPGQLVHRHRRHLVVAARDGFVQLTGWSPYPPGAGREAAR